MTACCYHAKICEHQNLKKKMLQWTWIIFWTPFHRLEFLQMRCFRKVMSGGSYTFGLLRKCTVSHWTVVEPNWQGPLHLTIKMVSDTMYEKTRWHTTSKITVPNHCEKYLNLAAKTHNLTSYFFIILHIYFCTSVLNRECHQKYRRAMDSQDFLR